MTSLITLNWTEWFAERLTLDSRPEEFCDDIALGSIEFRAGGSIVSVQNLPILSASVSLLELCTWELLLQRSTPTTIRLPLDDGDISIIINSTASGVVISHVEEDGVQKSLDIDVDFEVLHSIASQIQSATRSNIPSNVARLMLKSRFFASIFFDVMYVPGDASD